MNEITAYNLRITDDFIEILNETSFTLEPVKLEWDEIKKIAIHSRGLYSSPYITIFLKKEEGERYKRTERDVKNLLFITKKKGKKVIQFFEDLKNNFPEKDVIQAINIEDIKKRVLYIRINIIFLFSLFSFAVITFFAVLASKHWDKIAF